MLRMVLALMQVVDEKGRIMSWVWCMSWTSVGCLPLFPDAYIYSCRIRSAEYVL